MNIVERRAITGPLDRGGQEHTIRRNFPWSDRPSQSQSVLAWSDTPKRDAAFLIHCIKKVNGQRQLTFEQILDIYDLHPASTVPGINTAMQEAFSGRSKENFDGFETHAQTVSSYKEQLDLLFADRRLYEFLLKMRYVDSTRGQTEGVKEINPMNGITDAYTLTSTYHSLSELFYEEVSYRVPKNDYQIANLYASREDMESSLRLLVAEAVLKFNWEAYVIDPETTITRFHAFLQSYTQKITNNNSEPEERNVTSLNMQRAANSDSTNDFSLESLLPALDSVEGEVLSAEVSSDILSKLEEVAQRISPVARDIFLGSVLDGISDDKLAQQYGFSNPMEVASMRQRVQRVLAAELDPSMREEISQRVSDDFIGSRVERQATLWGKMLQPQIQTDLLQRLDKFEESMTKTERILHAAVALVRKAHREQTRLSTKDLVKAICDRLSMPQAHPEAIESAIRLGLGMDNIRERKAKDVSYIGLVDKHRATIQSFLDAEDTIDPSPLSPKQTRYKIFQAFLDSTATTREELIADIKTRCADDEVIARMPIKVFRPYLLEMIFKLDRSEDIIISQHRDQQNIWRLLGESGGQFHQRFERIKDTLDPQDRSYLETIFQVADGKMTTVLFGLQREFRKSPQFRELFRARTYVYKLLVQTGIVSEQEMASLEAHEKNIDPYSISAEAKTRLRERLELVNRPHLGDAEKRMVRAALQVAAPHHINDVERFYRDMVPLVGLDSHGKQYSSLAVRKILQPALRKILSAKRVNTIMGRNVSLFDLLVEQGREKVDEMHDRWITLARNGPILRYAIQNATGDKITTLEVLHNRFPEYSRYQLERIIKNGIMELFEEDERQQLYNAGEGIWKVIAKNPETILSKLQSARSNGLLERDRLKPIDRKALDAALKVLLQRKAEGRHAPKYVVLDEVCKVIYGQRYKVADEALQSRRQRTIDRSIRRAVNILYERETYSKELSSGERLVGWRWRQERRQLQRFMQNPEFPSFFQHKKNFQRIFEVIQRYYINVPEDQDPPTLLSIAEDLGVPLTERAGFNPLLHDIEYIRKRLLAPYMSRAILEGLSNS